MKLHYGKLAVDTFTATTEAVGYPASNLGSESLAKPYRATGAGATDIVLQLAAPATIQTLFLHDVNFAAATIAKSVDGVAWVPVGELDTYADRHGRRRGVLILAAAGQLSVKMSIAAGATGDGLGYWRAGAAYLFGAMAAPSALPSYGYTVRTRRPRVSVDLPNGRTAAASTGPNVDRVELTLDRQSIELADDLVQRTTAGTCVLDLELSRYPEQLWPVRCVEQDLSENFRAKVLSSIVLPFSESA